MCPKCAQSVPKVVPKVCPKCAQSVTKVCPKCAQSVPRDKLGLPKSKQTTLPQNRKHAAQKLPKNNLMHLTAFGHVQLRSFSSVFPT